MILGAMAEGITEVTGLLEGADILSTAQAMRDFGAEITRQDDGSWTVKGCGAVGFTAPANDVDCGNAGTGVRLIMGAAAGYPLSATFTGDASLSSRPMARGLNPLSEMGVTYEAQEGGRLPATLTSNGKLSPLDYTPPHASAQVKSAILLAGLNTAGVTTVNEPTLSRDHTENMLKAFGAEVTVKAQGEGQKVSVKGPVTLKATTVNVPGDPSSAAFPIVAALTTPGSDIVIENVMMNPTRTGLFETLTEYPILAIAAAHANGTTIMRGIAEMRVKESDRISATVALLEGNGVETTEYEDGFAVKGGAVAGGGTVVTHHDHRIAMSALILGMNAVQPIAIDDASMIATSFPTFFELMNGIGAKIETAAA
jgi:3-phosphoshikimate 1-carboxyvinyltransferase